MIKKKRTKKPKKRKKMPETTEQVQVKEDIVQSPEQSETSFETQQEQTTDNPVEQKKPCNSCTVNYINKKLRTQYIVTGLSIAAFLGSIWGLKKFESRRTIFSALAGALAVITAFGISNIITLHKMKSELTNKQEA